MNPRPGATGNSGDVNAELSESERGAAINAARDSLSELLGAERRLRARDQQRHDRLTYAQSRALIALAESAGTDDELSAGQLARAADLHPATVPRAGAPALPRAAAIPAPRTRS